MSDFTKNDWFFLRKPLLVIFGVSLFTVGLIFGLRWFNSNLDEQISMLQSNENQLRSEEVQLQDDIRQMEAFADSYERAVLQRFLEPADRLDWIEALNSIEQNYLLPQLRYSLQPMKPVKVASDLEFGRLKLHTTEVSLDSNLLHEGDFFSVIQNMQAAYPWRLIPDNCSLTNEISRGGGILEPKLRAVCTLNWLSFEEVEEEAFQ